MQRTSPAAGGQGAHGSLRESGVYAAVGQTGVFGQPRRYDSKGALLDRAPVTSSASKRWDGLSSRARWCVLGGDTSESAISWFNGVLSFRGELVHITIGRISMGQVLLWMDWPVH